jgi:hypothetical protein
MRANTDGTATFRGPCSGSSLGDRVSYPLTGGQIALAQGAAVDNINFMWTGDISQEPHTFKTYGEPTVIDAEPGHVCAKGPDFASLGFKSGDVATLMVMYQADGPPRKGTDKRWQYICADVTLSDSWTKPTTGFACPNAGDFRVAKEDEIMNVTLSSDPSQNGRKSSAEVSSSGLTPAEAGGVGAGVAVGVVLAALGILFAIGYRFNKKRQSPTLDDASSMNSTMKDRV